MGPKMAQWTDVPLSVELTWISHIGLDDVWVPQNWDSVPIVDFLLT